MPLQTGDQVRVIDDTTIELPDGMVVKLTAGRRLEVTAVRDADIGVLSASEDRIVWIPAKLVRRA